MNPLMRKLKQEDMARPKTYLQILDEKQELRDEDRRLKSFEELYNMKQ